VSTVGSLTIPGSTGYHPASGLSGSDAAQSGDQAEAAWSLGRRLTNIRD